MTLSRTLFQGSSASCCNIYAASRLMDSNVRPPVRTEPVDGFSRPAIRFKTEDFPQPVGPTSATNWPRGTVKERLFKTPKEPNCSPIESSETSAGCIGDKDLAFSF